MLERSPDAANVALYFVGFLPYLKCTGRARDNVDFAAINSLCGAYLNYILTMSVGYVGMNQPLVAGFTQKGRISILRNANRRNLAYHRGPRNARIRGSRGLKRTVFVDIVWCYLRWIGIKRRASSFQYYLIGCLLAAHVRIGVLGRTATPESTGGIGLSPSDAEERLLATVFLQVFARALTPSNNK